MAHSPTHIGGTWQAEASLRPVFGTFMQVGTLAFGGEGISKVREARLLESQAATLGATDATAGLRSAGRAGVYRSLDLTAPRAAAVANQQREIAALLRRSETLRLDASSAFGTA